jgi:tetratricopeptide (TPR) repeat protein
VAAAVGAVSVVRRALAETVLQLSVRYPLPPAALARAYALEPDNPEAAYRLASYDMDAAQPPNLAEAARLLDESLALAPRRVPTWLALGRRFELEGREADAEQAYLRAASLAPSFWKPQWVLGNLYVRQGRTAEGIEALGRASDRNTDIIALAIRTAWRATDGDVAAASRAAGGSLRGRSDLLEFLVQQQQVDAALATWTDLAGVYPDASAVPLLGRAIANQLLAAGRPDDALRIWARLTPGSVPGLERIQNPGFDAPIDESAGSPFSWAVTQAPEARVSVDLGRSGTKALRVDYKVKNSGGFTHASEYVRVRPGAAYTLSFWARTDDLQSGGLPSVGVGDAANREPGSATRVLPAGTSDWTEYHVDFKAPSSGLVVVAVSRASCGDVCPIYGTVWIDDISLAAR